MTTPPFRRAKCTSKPAAHQSGPRAQETIDNDLPLPESAPTFGFETARHYGVFIVRCLAEDAKTTGRWYLIVSMGRRGAPGPGIGRGMYPDAHSRRVPRPGKRLTLDELCDIIVGSMPGPQARRNAATAWSCSPKGSSNRSARRGCCPS